VEVVSNILVVRTVAAEYLLAMKLMSGRQYKYDMSDIVGILWEHQMRGETITREMINLATLKLYGEESTIPESSTAFLNAVINADEYESLYSQIREYENESKAYLMKFDEQHPDMLKGGNINDILRLRKQKDGTPSGDFLAKLDGFKKKVAGYGQKPSRDKNHGDDIIE